MSHAISLSLRADPSSFGRQGEDVKDGGVWGGVKLYG